MKKIHPTAIVHPSAKIGKNVTIEAYVVINSPYIIIGDDVIIKSHVYLDGHLRIGKGTTIWPFASIGTQTQDLKYKGEVTYVEIGENCQIREYVTINSSCGEGTKVIVGDQCLIMAYCHVAHNCEIGNGVIMSNGATLAGHVTVGDHAILGGVCAVHQFTRIGAYAMVGGGSMVGQDLPPFCIGTGFPLRVVGLNLVGLKRHKFSLELRKQLIKAYRVTYQSGLAWELAKEQIQEEFDLNESLLTWIEFCDKTIRGLSPLRKKSEVPEENQALAEV
jgi:UDP-N-acetylglucosamine acyltransferase